jgi:hypothetical protein
LYVEGIYINKSLGNKNKLFIRIKEVKWILLKKENQA